MSVKDDGGPAFPVPSYVNADGDTFESKPAGMSLRDWFAGQALPAVIARGLGDGLSPKSDYAAHAYVFADAMLRARK